jgi:predicted  nucleic acid-binding Zn-ribbon protein
LLPTEIDEKGVAYFEIRRCQTCDLLFSLTMEECDADLEPVHCPECRA